MRLHRYEEAAQWLAGYHPVQLQTGSLQQFLIPVLWKRADRIKAVHYEGDGFCLLYKRYENGRLQWPRTGEEAKQISDQQLRWLLEGLNPEQPKAVQKWLPHKSENTENP